MFTDLFTMFSATVPNVGLAALILTAWVIALNVCRDAFDIDDKPRRVISPLGDDDSYIGWRYMSDYAEDCRALLDTFSKGFHGLVTAMVAAIVSFFVIDAVFYILSAKSFPAGDLHRFGIWWVSNVKILEWLGDGMQLAVVLAGPIIIWNLSKMAYLVVHARKNYRVNKYVASSTTE